jgi:hypothetical protein
MNGYEDHYAMIRTPCISMGIHPVVEGTILN